MCRKVNKVNKLQKFMEENDMTPYDVTMVLRHLTSCGTCKYFIRHYDKDGKALTWGHCSRWHIERSKEIGDPSCEEWDSYKE